MLLLVTRRDDGRRLPCPFFTLGTTLQIARRGSPLVCDQSTTRAWRKGLTRWANLPQLAQLDSPACHHLTRLPRAEGLVGLLTPTGEGIG